VAGRTRRRVEAEGQSWNERPREGSARTVMGAGREGIWKWWSSARDGEEGAALEGRRFGRSRSSESESEETLEGSLSATKSAAVAAAIGQEARCSGLLGQRLLESEWGHWIPWRIVDSQEDTRPASYFDADRLLFLEGLLHLDFPLSADERGGYGRTDPTIFSRENRRRLL